MGVDTRDVVTGHEVKSIGHEQTFMEDIVDKRIAKRELLSLSNRVARRMRQKKIKGKTVTLKVKYKDFVQITRSTSIPKSIDDGLEIYALICGLLVKTAIGSRPVRLLGVSCSQISSTRLSEQLSLFQGDGGGKKRDDLNRAVDSLRDKFGERSVRPGALIETK